MPRTGINEVKGIIQVDETLDLNGCITTAHIITNKVARNDTGSTLLADELVEIERQLAAHFYSNLDPQFQSKQTGRSGGTFQGKTEMFFSASKWGQTALLIDTTGYLAKLEKDAKSGGKSKIGVYWLGSPRGRGAQEDEL